MFKIKNTLNATAAVLLALNLFGIDPALSASQKIGELEFEVPKIVDPKIVDPKKIKKYYTDVDQIKKGNNSTWELAVLKDRIEKNKLYSKEVARPKLLKTFLEIARIYKDLPIFLQVSGINQINKDNDENLEIKDIPLEAVAFLDPAFIEEILNSKSNTKTLKLKEVITQSAIKQSSKDAQLKTLKDASDREQNKYKANVSKLVSLYGDVEAILGPETVASFKAKGLSYELAIRNLMLNKNPNTFHHEFLLLMRQLIIEYNEANNIVQ